MFHEYKLEGICNFQDGAGHVEKMLYALQDKKFDYDLKKLRFAGELLMELVLS